MTHTKPEFIDILNLLGQLPVVAPYEPQKTDIDTLPWLRGWLAHYSKIYDFTKGFDVNRCALYWAGYDHADGFDGKSFVETCKDGRGSLRQLASILDTDLQIFELDPSNHAKADSPALAMAASYGMMAIEESTQLFCAAGFGQGVDIAAKNALRELEPVNKAGFDIESFMVAHCGLDHAAMLGCAIAANMKGIPCIMEGANGLLVRRLLEKATGQNAGTVITTESIPHLQQNDGSSPGQNVMTCAVLLKTLYAGSIKTPCGKVKQVA